MNVLMKFSIEPNFWLFSGKNPQLTRKLTKLRTSTIMMKFRSALVHARLCGYDDDYEMSDFKEIENDKHIKWSTWHDEWAEACTICIAHSVFICIQICLWLHIAFALSGWITGTYTQRERDDSSTLHT